MSCSSTPTERVSPQRDPGHAAAAHACAWADVVAAVGSDAQRGLDRRQVEAARRVHGWNELARAPKSSVLARLARQFRDLVIWILIAAGAIAALLGETTDAMAILAIVLLNGLLGFVQEERAARALEALRRMAVPSARVVRDGVVATVSVRELVPGDRIELEAGDQVPADARLIHCFSFRTQEAALTGESTPVSKHAEVVLGATAALAERANMVYMGTTVAAGTASALVVTTGMRTELGRIAELLQRGERKPTPLQVRLAELGRVLIASCLGIVALISAIHLLRGGDLVEVFLLAVSLAVAAVPEGLPAVVTVALGLGLQRMARRHALIRKLPSVETLGSVTFICSDKTGTLTRNEMTVREIVAGGVFFEVTGAGYDPQGEIRRTDAHATAPYESDDLRWTLEVGSACNKAQLTHASEQEGWLGLGDPTEIALLVAACKGGVGDPKREGNVVDEIPFASERQMMSMLVAKGDGQRVLYTKGAPEAVVRRCSHERLHGRVVELTDDRRREILDEASVLASRALRVLAMAYHPVGDDCISAQEHNLVFAGLQGMMDPPREEVRAAVRTCRSAGLRPVMITGDHPRTALAIAHELGLASAEAAAVTGKDLDAMSDSELAERVVELPVYARVSAEHKLRVVHALQARGEIVAMTGDGVNDAPAVQEADIGVAMGVTGTDVTREAADMVLLDDNFASIVAAVEEGRSLFDNIQKFVHYLLATNAGEVLLMLSTAVAGWPIPLAAVQILWINLVTDGLPALALGVEPPEPDVMSRRPRRLHEPVLGKRHGVRILVRGLLVAAAGVTAFAVVYGEDPARLVHARTATFCTVAYAQLLMAFAFRSDRFTLGELGLLSNTAMLAAIAAAGLIQLGAVTLPFAETAFEAAPLSPIEWLWVVGLALLPTTVVEVSKLVRARLESGSGRGDSADGGV